jgi:hypothetical protein
MDSDFAKASGTHLDGAINALKTPFLAPFSIKFCFLPFPVFQHPRFFFFFLSEKSQQIHRLHIENLG